MGFAVGIAWDLVEVLARIPWTPSHLLHESAVIRDQVCLSSNKERCLLTHPLFEIYKPDPLARTAHLRPPPSCRLSTSIIVPVVSEQSENENNGACTLFGGGNWVRSV